MAAGHTDYQRGEMEVSAHKHTFGGFMNWTMYGGAMVALIVIYPTLIFGVQLTWPSALITTAIVGILLGLGLKLKGGWYAGVIIAAVVVGIITSLLTALAG